MNNIEDVTRLLVNLLRKPEYALFSQYGYEVYLPALMRIYYASHGVLEHKIEYEIEKISPLLYASAWDLCRRGILRPGVKQYGAQATDNGNAGDGYSITPFGKQWLAESNLDDFVPTEPGRFAAILAKYRNKFGPGFHERAQQAVNCYGAHAFLACCVMCGAAAESIILSTAIAKRGDEAEVLRVYVSGNGRRRIENLLIGQVHEQLQNDFRNNTTLLKYWRDEAAHGRESNISDEEAYISLALLLRLAIFMNDNWGRLIQ